MRGLIKKDFISVSKKIKFINRLIIIFGIIALLISLKSAATVVLSIFLPMMAVSFSVTLINEDDKCKWDRYAIALPVTKKEIIASRYLFCILQLAGYFIFNVLIGILMYLLFHEYSLLQSIIIVFIGIGFAMLYLSLLLPCQYKYGFNGGYAVMVILTIISGISVFLTKKGYVTVQKILELPMAPSAILSIVVICVVVFLSYLISVKIYKQNHS